MIRFENVSKNYGEYAALRDISFHIEKGEFITVIGSSGCGKTTMLKLINGLLLPDRGKIKVQNRDITQTDLITLRRNIGYVIQNVGLFSHLNIKKNITFIPDLLDYPPAEMEKIALRLIHTVGLEEEMLLRYPSELSGGQKQRIGVARALAASPKILLMDEPFGALDEITRNHLQDEIKKIHKELELTTVFITHDLREAAKLGDRVFLMDQGKLIRVIPREELGKIELSAYP